MPCSRRLLRACLPALVLLVSALLTPPPARAQQRPTGAGAIGIWPISVGATGVGATGVGATGVGATGAGVVGVWPLQPRPEVVAVFDPPSSPYGSGHRGVDLLGHVGLPVRSALGGTVTYAGPLAGRGVVVVDSGDTRTTYQPVQASVTVGEHVAAGDPIGTLVAVGSHCAPRSCLHWGWIRGETYLDPLLLVGAGPVRLLPLWRDSPAPARTAQPMLARLAAQPLLAAQPQLAAQPELAAQHQLAALPYAGWRPPWQVAAAAP